MQSIIFGNFVPYISSRTHTQRKGTDNPDNTLEMPKRFLPVCHMYIVYRIVSYRTLISITFVYSMWSIVRCVEYLNNCSMSWAKLLLILISLFYLSLSLSIHPSRYAIHIIFPYASIKSRTTLHSARRS